ncbi:MAG: hypothetical protein WA789_15255 [Candidatus Acidiferrum sp.]
MQPVDRKDIEFFGGASRQLREFVLESIHRSWHFAQAAGPQISMIAGDHSRQP